MSVVDVHRGASPVLLAFPHAGTEVPADVHTRLDAEGRRLRDTDWHVDRLYDGLLAEVTTVRARVHRYVVDVNRDPCGKSLYPGQNTTALVPRTDFDNRPIWKDGAAPDADEIGRRIERFHRPFHEALAAEIERVRALHGVAILYDCHSIRSVVPFLFEGRLPDFNIGTDDGRTCDRRVEMAAAEICASASGYSSVVNGRFRGGWTVRHYGRPRAGVHAIQMELAQATHLSSEAPPFAFDEDKAARLRTHLSAILARLADLAPHLKSGSGEGR